MRVTEDERIAGLLVIEPDMHADERGFLCVTSGTGIFPEAVPWRQLLTRSARRVIRGLHVRSGAGEAKLVRCSLGMVFDVVLDLRPGSPTCRSWASWELAGASQVSLYIPAGCAHGWQALSAPADMSYLITGAHDPAEDLEIAWDDRDLEIGWPLPPHPASRRGALSPAEAVKLLSG